MQHLDAVFDRLKTAWGGLDFLVHSIAFSDKNELKGSFVENTTRENFLRSMDISAFSFVAAGKRASKLMERGGSMITLTYLGAERVLPSYNVMGVAKAASKRACATWRAISGPKAFASTPSAPAPCARSPSPASKADAASSQPAANGR